MTTDIDLVAKRGEALVEQVQDEVGLVPATAIAIAIDTAYVGQSGGGTISSGVYMFDNRTTNGSSGQGSLELSTVCHVGDFLGFIVYPMNTNLGDTCAITHFNMSQGRIFGTNGWPKPFMSRQDYWVGQAQRQSDPPGQPSVYQLYVQITRYDGSKYNIMWDPYLTVS